MSDKQSKWDDFIERFGKMEQIAQDNREDIKSMKTDITDLKVSRAHLLGIGAGAGAVVSLIVALFSTIWSK